MYLNQDYIITDINMELNICKLNIITEIRYSLRKHRL
jgi:hypothetical protein